MHQDRWNELQKARHDAHQVFDRIWREAYMSRRRAYAWLSKATGIPEADCHFRFFDVGLCEAVAVISRRKLKRLQAKRRVWNKIRFSPGKGGKRKF